MSLSLAFVLALPLGAAVGAAGAPQQPSPTPQEVSPRVQPADAAALAPVPERFQDPLPGSLPGTQRWIVLMRGGTLDLAPLRQAFATGAPAGVVDAIVADLAVRAEAEHAPIARLVRAEGGAVVRHFWLVDACAVDVPPAALPRLRALPNVADLQPDVLRKPGIKTSTNAQNHGTDVVQANGVLGAGATVAVIDSGVDAMHAQNGRPHATFYPDGNPQKQTGGGIGGSRLLANVQLGTQPPEDVISHGTGVAGVIAGDTWNATGAADRGHAPAANIVSYSVADTPSGLASALTLGVAWQQVVIDKARYNISVANCSYEGSYLPGAFDQQMLDQMVSVSGVVATVMAGNDGTSGGQFTYGAVNALAVGAVAPNTRAVAPFSSRGPLLGDAQRFYPDLVANGVGMVVPLADNEGSAKMASGTSYSCAQVAGAAVLYRSLKPQAPATEVMAMILATGEDVAGKNRTPPVDDRNAYGLGYPRVDRLVAALGAQPLVHNAAVTATAPVQVPFQVQLGQHYAVALTWLRHNPSTLAWSDLDVEVAQGTRVLATAATPRNVHEMVRFTADFTGQATLTVRAVTVENGRSSVPFSLVAVPTLPYFEPGSAQPYGTACPLVAPVHFAAPLTAPILGEPWAVRVAASGLNRAVVLLLGASRTTWANVPLPFDLTPFGAPGCALLASPDMSLVRAAVTSPEVVFTMLIPGVPSLLGQSLFEQAFGDDPNANVLGTAFSAGVHATVGGQR